MFNTEFIILPGWGISSRYHDLSTDFKPLADDSGTEDGDDDNDGEESQKDEDEEDSSKSVDEGKNSCFHFENLMFLSCLLLV